MSLPIMMNSAQKRKIDDEDDRECKDRLLVHSEKRHKSLLHSTRGFIPAQNSQLDLRFLEPFLRRTVQDGVRDGISNHIMSLNSKVPCNQIQAAPRKQYRLEFQNNLPKKLFTNNRVETEDGNSIQISIIDCFSNNPVKFGPLSSAKVEILVLDGDFCPNGRTEWTKKDFDKSIVCERMGKRPILAGNGIVVLKNGSAFIQDIRFTDNSRWLRSGKFRLGARVCRNEFADNVLEAMTGAFAVKDQRGETYKKHHPPSLTDEVWRLEKIRKDGAFHKRLKDNGVSTVEEFLKNLVIDEDCLHRLLGSGMSKKMWDKTVKHAWECIIPKDKHYAYHSIEGVVLFFDSVHQLVGARIDNIFYRINEVPPAQKDLVCKLKQDAYESPRLIIDSNEELINIPRIADSPFSNASWPTQQRPVLPAINRGEPIRSSSSSKHGDFFIETDTIQEQQSVLEINCSNFYTCGYTEPSVDIDEMMNFDTEVDLFVEFPDVLGQVGDINGCNAVTTNAVNGVSFKCILVALKWVSKAKRPLKKTSSPFAVYSPGINVTTLWDYSL